MEWHAAACRATEAQDPPTTDRPRKDTRTNKGSGPASLNAAGGTRQWRGAGAMEADNQPKTKEEVQYTPAPTLHDLDSAAGAFSSLRNGITPSAVGTAVCCAPPG